MSDWEFPEKLQTFNPQGGMFEHVFKNPIALIAYAQYRRKHIVSKKLNEYLPTFSLAFANEITVEKEFNRVRKGQAKITLDEAIAIWMRCWEKRPGHPFDGPDYEHDKWAVIIEPILPFLNGEQILVLEQEGERFFLITKKVTI